MEKVDVDAVESDAGDSGIERWRLAEPLGTSDLAINRYRLAPGEGLPGGLHAHADQEEVFVVLSGEATFETLAGDVGVAAGEAVRFAPGEFQSGANGGDGDLVVLALGAPRDSEDVRIPVACPECGHGDVRLRTDDGDVRFVCPDCGASRVPGPCPECGTEDLRVTLGERGAVVVRCTGCAAEFDSPPVRGEW